MEHAIIVRELATSKKHAFQVGQFLVEAARVNTNIFIVVS